MLSTAQTAYCFQVLASRMAEAPQPSVSAPKKEEKVVPAEETARAAREDERQELPTDE